MLIHSAEITGSVQLNNTDVSGITNVAGFATTGSNQFNGNQSISGSITSNGTITAQTLVVQTVTSSIEFVTGSTRNGSLSSNTHQFTGSVLVTGSGTFTSKLSVNNPVSPYANGITVGGTGTGIMMYSTSTGSQTSIQIINASNYNYGTIGVVSGTGNIGGDIYGLGYTGNSNSTFTSVLNWTSTGNVGIGTTSSGSFVEIYSTSSYGGGSGTLKINSNTNGQTVLNMSNQSVPKSYEIAVGGTTNSTPGAWYIYDNTAGAQRLTINATGNMGVGVIPQTFATTWRGAQVGNLSLMGPDPATDPNAIIAANAYYNSGWKRIISGTANYIELNQGGNISTYTSGTGAAGSTISPVTGPYVANGGVSWTNGSSDIRKKKNFEPSQGLAEVLQIEAVKYHFSWDEDNAPKRLGFKAQNLQTIIPEMVMETGELAEDNSSYLTITPDYILPVLVKAIQEQQAQIEELKALLNA